MKSIDVTRSIQFTRYQLINIIKTFWFKYLIMYLPITCSAKAVGNSVGRLEGLNLKPARQSHVRVRILLAE